MEEAVGIGEERSRLGKHLRVGHPSEAFVALWAIGGHREIVGTLSPERVGDELVDVFVARCYRARLHVLRYRRDGNGAYAADDHLVGSRYGGIAIAEEGVARGIVHKVVPSGKGIDETEVMVEGAQVAAVDTALRTVHTTAFGTIAIVQNLARQTGQHGSFLGFEDERRHGGAVLAEVDHQRLTRPYHDGGVNCIFTLYDYPAMLHVFFLFCLLGIDNTLPNVCPHGLQGKVATLIYFCPVGRQYLTGELSVRYGQWDKRRHP